MNLTRCPHYYCGLILPDLGESQIYFWNWVFMTVLLVALIVYIIARFPRDIHSYMMFQHILLSNAHLCIIAVYHILKYHQSGPTDEPTLHKLEQAYKNVDMCITFTTFTISWIVFLRVFLFREGEPLYRIWEILVLTIVTVGSVRGCEIMMDTWINFSRLLVQLRLISVLTFMAVPVGIFGFIVGNMFQKAMPPSKHETSYFLAHLFVFSFSDFILFMYNFYTDNVFWICALSFRYVFEFVWYIVSDIYFHKYFRFAEVQEEES